MSVADASAIEGSNTLKLLDRFVAQGSGGLSTSNGSTFGPDGNLYVVTAPMNAVLRYDGVTGAFQDAFVPSGSGGLNNPLALAFGPDGMLYVSGFGTNQVLRYDGSSGAFLDTVATAPTNASASSAEILPSVTVCRLPR